MLGAMLVFQRSAGIDIWRSPLAMILGVNLLLTFSIPQISIGGHVGGLIAGGALGAGMLELVRRRAPAWLAPSLVFVLSVALIAGSIWAAASWRDPILGSS